MKIAYLTDSGCGYSMDEMAEEKIFSLPLQISYDNHNFFDNEQIKHNEVIKLLEEGKTFKTSQPNLGLIDELFKKLKAENYTDIIAVPISSGLSGTMNSFYLKAKEHGLNINCIEIFTSFEVQAYTIKYIRKMIEEKKLSFQQVIDNANKFVEKINSIILPMDINHLKKGGRLTSAAAMLANLLKIFPILKINHETKGKIEAIGKVRTFKKAVDTAIEIALKEIKDRLDYILYVAHVNNYDLAASIKEKIISLNPSIDIQIISICSPVAVHCGDKAIGLHYFPKLY